MDTGILLRTLLLSIILAGFFNCKRSLPAENKIATVDSLIQEQWINEATIMVYFGADAITAINTEKGIVVIDAGISTALTQKYRRRIERDFQLSHFSYVINTHTHHDHCRGNSVFPEAHVVAHENGPLEMEIYWKDPEQVAQSLGSLAKEYEAKAQECLPLSEDWLHNFTQQIRYQYACEDAGNRIPIRKPDILFSDSLLIDLGDITFELKYFGRCHSNNDILVYIPQLKILFCGDLIFPYGRPSIRENMTDQQRWLEAIEWTEKRMDKIDIVIGGHGQLLTREDLQAFCQIILEKTQ